MTSLHETKPMMRIWNLGVYEISIWDEFGLQEDLPTLGPSR